MARAPTPMYSIAIRIHWVHAVIRDPDIGDHASTSWLAGKESSSMPGSFDIPA
jgi:hypothetical protein